MSSLALALALDFVSPLPPVRSGIADYSADLLPSLEPLCDLRVLALPGQPVASEVVERWHPAGAEQALEAEALRAETIKATKDSAGRRLPLYQMGNNLYHEAVASLAHRWPGVLVLHDLVLHHLAMEETLARGVLEPYRQRLRQDHGDLGEAVAIARRWGYYSDAALFSLPAHRGLLRSQRGILVHSRWAAEMIAEEDPEIRVRVVPMGVPLPTAADRSAGLAFRRRHSLPEDRPILGSFGFQTPIKRTQKAVEALAHAGLEEVHLLVAGQVSEACDLEGMARRLGVAERVHVLGFLPFEDFEAAIAATDLCVNLRYPTAGETSASLLRVLAVGRPALVSDYAQFSELPDEVALKAPLGDDEVPALAAALRRLLADPQGLEAMGERAREYVRRHHAPEAAAQAVVEACLELRELLPPGPTPVAEAVPSTLHWGQVRGQIALEEAAEPWPEGSRRRLKIRLHNAGPSRWLPARDGVGGVALQVQLLELDGEGRPTRDLRRAEPWLPLPAELGPGESVALPLTLRRPLGPGRLRIEPHIVGFGSFRLAGGPVGQWEWSAGPSHLEASSGTPRISTWQEISS